MPARFDPIASLLLAQPVVLLDGGMGSELAFRGHDLSDVLWSARLLVDDPGAIRDVHLDYLAAGADLITTASYQVSYEGFGALGLSRGEVDGLLGRSVELAREARDACWEARDACWEARDADPELPDARLHTSGPAGPRGRSGQLAARARPLVAASVGPFGAARGDGSEYVGRYGLSTRALAAWHRPRLEALVRAEPDLLACETLPCIEEAEALLRLLGEEPSRLAWMSFSCRDGAHVSQGEPFAQAVALCAESPQVVAVGLNCVKPRYVTSLLRAARGSADAAGKPLVAYPNSSEEWDPVARAFGPRDPDEPDFASQGPLWRDEGARLIGGCCRIRPPDIRRLRALLLGPGPDAGARARAAGGAAQRGQTR